LIYAKASCTQYGGNYDGYKAQRQAEVETEWQEYNQYIDEKKRLERAHLQKLETQRRTTNEKYDTQKYQDHSAFDGHKNAAERAYGKQLRAMKSRIAQVEEVQRPEAAKNYKVVLGGKTHNAKLLLRLQDISKSYGKPVLQNITLEIRGGERLQVKGKNGSGKTTLLKIAAGLLKPDSGEVAPGTNVSIGYFSQDADGLDSRTSALDNLVKTQKPLHAIYNQAISLGLKPEDLKKKPGELSRGQQAKLAFTHLLLSEHQLLILDEPTNHLDIPTRERVETALQQYTGALLVASHDSYFLEQVTINQFIELYVVH
jgi:ATPase subunit of ABC transporter with duplicated ATPase domains